MREAAWQNRIDELEQLLREAEEKVNERDAIFLEGVPTTTTTTTIKSNANVLEPYAEEEEEATTLLQFQHQLLREQDEELTDLSNHVTRTKHIAIAVGEESDLHTRLLDDFDDDVEHTAGNLKRIASSARRLFERIGKSNFSLGCCLAALVFMLIVLIALSILKVEGKFHPIFT